MEVDTSDRQKADEPSFNLDKAVLLKWMFDLAGRKLTRASNRAFVYRLVKKLADCTDQSSSVEMSQSGNEEDNFVCDIRFLLRPGKVADQQQMRQASGKVQEEKE